MAVLSSYYVIILASCESIRLFFSAADPSLDINSPSAPVGSVGSRSSSIPSQPSPSTSGTGVQAPSAPSYHHSPASTVSNATVPSTPTMPSGGYQQNSQYIFPFSQVNLTPPICTSLKLSHSLV